MVGPVDWPRVVRETFLYEDGCWKTCGGFCCANADPDFAFQLMPMQGTTLLYMEEEYEYLAAHGLVPEQRTHHKPPQTLSLDYGGPRPLVLYQTPCHLLGMCGGVIDKPLLCKLYPFLPVFDVSGRLESIVPASIFELTYDALCWPTPCRVRPKEGVYRRLWSEQPRLLDSLRHPYIMLYLMASKRFAENYQSHLTANTKLRGLTGRTFWKTWEIQYLSGRLFDLNRLKSDVLAAYRSLEERYGKFLKAIEGPPHEDA